MQFLDFKSFLYSDTLIPDIFISEYLPALKGEYVKLYVYCVFLAKYGKSPSVSEVARVLDISADMVKAGLTFLSNQGILTWGNEGVTLIDLKEKEINRHYRPKSISSPEEAAERSRLNEKRRQVIAAINNTFFSGVMSPSWYLDIDTWFDLYNFEEDVMLLLFKHCFNNNGLARHYIAKVAENWHHKGIRNSFDLDVYMQEYAKMKEVSKKVQRRLRIRKPLDEHQEAIVEKWVNEYNFSFEIIDLALKSTTYATTAGFSYFDKILTGWRSRGLDTVEKINADRELQSKSGNNVERRAPRGGRQNAGGRPGNGGNVGPGFEGRKYDDEFYESFVSSEFGVKKEGK